MVGVVGSERSAVGRDGLEVVPSSSPVSRSMSSTSTHSTPSSSGPADAMSRPVPVVPVVATHVVAVEEVEAAEEEVGHQVSASLLLGPLVAGAEGAGQGGEQRVGLRDVAGGQLAGHPARPVRSLRHRDPPLGERVAVPGGEGEGFALDDEPQQPGRELAGVAGARGVDGARVELVPGGVLGGAAGSTVDDLQLVGVDVAATVRLPDGRQARTDAGAAGEQAPDLPPVRRTT